jgi:type II secretory ATPase GspE/PulE/Tfp pilus assembly ATPase PilB-like protein
MIRNPIVFFLALVSAVLLAIQGNLVTVENYLDIPGVLENALPSTRFLLATTVLLVVLSVLPLDFLGEKKRSKRSKGVFTKDSLSSISARIADLAKGPGPDVPFIIDYTIFQAKAAGASDIHLDPSRSGFTVRFRIDGMMRDIAHIPSKLTGLISNRLKVLSNLVVYQGYLPQDGRLETDKTDEDKTLEHQGMDFRIAFMPTLHGERIVIRILGGEGEALDFGELGMGETQQQTMNQLLLDPQGMIVLTGPTGSGKTTTIYTALRSIQDQARSARSISTLEDPIEYEIPGVNQSQVDEKKGFTFDKGLRSVLRQDPDVIMVGEIRDSETAKIAIQAGMTGHLIISTVHANSSASTFSRLLEMGVAPHSLNSTITAVIAQRLVRRVCPSCRSERPITDSEITELKTDRLAPDTLVFEGSGCGGCGGSGYKGRHALFELLPVTEDIRALIADGAPADTVYSKAIEEGMTSLYASGLRAIEKGMTTVSEIIRVVHRN